MVEKKIAMKRRPRRQRRQATVPPRRRMASKHGGSTMPGAFPVVGLGASAGGLDAFKRFVTALDANSGMAFILIQHLDPNHPSMIVDLLAEHTVMKLQQAEDGMRIEPNHVYTIPPGVYLSLRGGAFQLSQPPERHGARLPFDFFLRSMAEAYGERAIAVVLSGTGADGSLGVKAIKEKNGLVIAQDPADADYDGMPRSAIAAAAVDLVLPVDKIPDAIVRYGRRMALKRTGHLKASEDQLLDGPAQIIELLRAKTARDFRHYKPGTLQRRIARRMAIAGATNSDRYLALLQRDAKEAQLLAKDLLINVTSFFRDPPVFEYLAKQIIPELIREHGSGQPLRIWVAGCSTGEETYSIAMLLLEAVAKIGRQIKLQVFASDIDTDAVDFARQGLYSESIEADVSRARLKRFFAKEDHFYRVVPALREIVVFAVQDVLVDPPFSRLDLVSCRNLLIYLRPEAQEKALRLFHFALREGGFLCLGSAETIGQLSDRFAQIPKTQRLYRRIGLGGTPVQDVDSPLADSVIVRAKRMGASAKPSPDARLGEIAQGALLDTYAPASVLINDKYEMLYCLGPTDRYLRVVAGPPSHDLLAMVHDGLRNKLRAAVRQASYLKERTVLAGAQTKRDGAGVVVTIAAQPVPSAGQGLFLVSFFDEPAKKPGRSLKRAEDVPRVAELEGELDATRKELQSAIRDLELSGEEQKAINEEALSINEEFQSTNEELVTSKEELQSLNEELTALNNQLQETLEQQRYTSNDLQNILYSSDVATIFLDNHLNIRFFTPAAKSLFSVIASDIGRPLGDLTSLAPDPKLLADARIVLKTSIPVRHEIQAGDATWYIRRILPYRTDANRVEGVVITFADISEVKAAERKIEAARAYSERVINAIRQPLLVLDDALRIVSANEAFYRAFALAPEDAVGRHFAAASLCLAEIVGLRDFLQQVRSASPAPVADFEVETTLPGLGRRVLMMNARSIQDKLAGKVQILLAIDDSTEQRRAAQALEIAKHEAEQANLGKSRFLAAASHDLRQPLQTFSLLQGILAKKVKDPEALNLVIRIEETLGAMSGMLNTLLDINQLEAGIVRPTVATFPVQTLLEKLRTEFAYHAATRTLGWRVIPCSLFVRSDPRLLEQMMRNLLSNAAKYTEHGRVLLGCRRRGNKLRIEVWDTGPGIPQGQLQAIFEEFHQLENPARERSRGLGLGLAIVQRLADLLGHRVDVRSRPGKGSVFAIEVPLGRRDSAQPVAPALDDAVTLPHRGGTILLVEDEPDVREMLELLLKEEGYATLAAADGKQALALAAPGVSRPDIVIADYNLPNGLNGLEVAARLQTSLHQTLPVIILTGDISAGTLREIARYGYAQLNKPVKSQELTNLIGLLLSGRAAANHAESEASNDGQGPVIFVVDDDSAVRQSLQDLLRAEGRTVQLFASGEAFFQAYRPGTDGCLLVDAMMPGMTGFTLLHRLKDAGDRLPAIMITGNGDVHMAVRAMQAGAVDFIEKPVGADELLASIDHALEHPRDAEKRSAWREAAAKRLARLTARQRQILDLVLAGKPSKNIAVDLGLSQRTVETHRAAIMRKTGSKSLPALVRLALASS